jgi:hypothetical protein
MTLPLREDKAVGIGIPPDRNENPQGKEVLSDCKVEVDVTHSTTRLMQFDGWREVL